MDTTTASVSRSEEQHSPGGARKLICWVVLALFVALTIYGFDQGKLLRQEIWTPAGLRRFLIFAAGYWSCFGLFAAWKPGIFLSVVLSAITLYSIVAVGTIALLSVLLVTLASLLLGQTILERCDLADDSSVTMKILAALLGLSLYMFVLSVAALEPINYPIVYLAALAVPLIWRWRRTIYWLARIPKLWKPRHLARAEQFAAAALIFVLMLHWLVALEPEIGPDGLSIHLVVPDFMRTAHRWHFDVTSHLQAVMPKGANWLYTLCYFLGGEAAARLFNLSVLLGIVALLIATIRRWLPLAPALLLAALFAATPLAQLVTGSLFVENFWALLGLGALASLARYREQGREQFLYLAFVLAGAAVATKAIALAFIPGFGLIAIWTLWPRHTSLTQSVRRAGFALLCFFVFAAPPYWIAAVKTGNPFFPYFPHIFPGKFESLAEAFGGPPPTGPRTLAAPFYLTFRTGLYREVQNGAMGFQYLLFLPLGIVLLHRKWPNIALMSSATVALFTLATLAGDPTSRYFYAALPMATLVIAAAFGSLRTIDQRLYRASLALALAVLCLDIYFLPSSGWMFKDFVTNPASPADRAAYITAHAPERNLVAYLNRAHPGAPVAFFESESIAGLHAPALTTSWHNIVFYHRILNAASPVECLRILKESGIRFVIAPLASSGIPITTAPQESFLKQCTEPEFRSGNFYAGGVKESCVAESQPTPVLTAGEYDDRDARLGYSGLWSRMRFEQAAHGTLTASEFTSAALTLRFEGSELIYFYTKAFNRGIAEIFLDDVSQGSLDLYSPRVEWQTATSFRANGPGPHTFELRVSGRKNPAATGQFVDVDSLVVH